MNEFNLLRQGNTSSNRNHNAFYTKPYLRYLHPSIFWKLQFYSGLNQFEILYLIF